MSFLPLETTIHQTDRSQVCRGLAYLHANSVVHLDLKVKLHHFLHTLFYVLLFFHTLLVDLLQPENIVITEAGGQTVKIIDFGTARRLKDGEKVQRRSLIIFV